MATIEQELREALEAEAKTLYETTGAVRPLSIGRPSVRQAWVAAAGAAVLVVVAIGVVGLVQRIEGNNPSVDQSSASTAAPTNDSQPVVEVPVPALTPLPPDTIEVPMLPLTEATPDELDWLKSIASSDQVVVVGVVDGIRVFALLGVAIPEVEGVGDALCVVTFDGDADPVTACGGGSGFMEVTTVSPDMRQGTVGVGGGVEPGVAYLTLEIGDVTYSQRPTAGIVYLNRPFSPGDTAQWATYTADHLLVDRGIIELPYIAGTTTTISPTVDVAAEPRFPVDWPEFLGRTADVIVEEGGIGLALVKFLTDDGGWALAISTKGEYQGAIYLEGLGVGVGFQLGDSVDEVIVSGVAPLGTVALRVDYGGEQPMVLDRPVSRPEVGYTFFIGVAPTDAIGVLETHTKPVIETSALDENGNVVVSSSGTALINDPAIQIGEASRLVVDSITVAAIPEVIACQAPEGATPPPNQGGAVRSGVAHATSVEALEAFLAQGIGDPPIARSGYVEMIEPDGTVTYGIGTGDDYVTLISVIPIEGGWTVDHWEASGC